MKIDFLPKTVVPALRNKLFYGDNLEVLRKYIDSDSIDLCYIDPPFNSKRNYNQIYNNIGKEDKAQAQAFIDTWEWDNYADDGFQQIMGNTNNVFAKQSIELLSGLSKVIGKGSLLAYLVHMTLRIAEIYRVLKPTGCFYLHCDPTASHYLKLIIDSIFVSQGGDYLNEITWKRNFTKKGSQYKMHRFANNCDIIFFYSKSGKYFFETPKTKLVDKNEIEKLYDKVDDKNKRFKSEPIELPSMMARENLRYEYKGYLPAYGWMMNKEKLEDLDSKGKLYFTKNGKPRRKNFMEDYSGTEADNLWIDLLPLGQKQSEAMGYPTQKPEALLERIITASSQDGDTVLDAYCGCGTTVSVATNLKRKWIGIDITYQSISLILKRLEETFSKDVADSIELNGVPKDLASAIALAHKKDDRTRKEFEKWAVLTYSNNKAMINEKKGADHGIDGMAFMMEGAETFKDILFSVKSGHPNLSQFRDFLHVVKRDNAAIGIFITLEDPTREMISEAIKIGKYTNPLTEQTYEKVSIVTIEEILAGERLNVPTSIQILKKAEVTKNKNQHKLFD